MVSVVTIGIAGGTGAGKVRDKSKLLKATPCILSCLRDRLTNLNHSTTCMLVSLSSFGAPHRFFHNQTTLARKLYESLGEENVAYILHDFYYKDLSHKTVAERAANNFDHPEVCVCVCVCVCVWVCVVGS